MAAEFEVQKALYTAISGLGLTTYDSAPQQADGASLAVFPYVEVGAIILTEWDTAGETGFDFIARIHTRSRSAAMSEAKGIQAQIYARLHRGILAVTGFNTINVTREQSFCELVGDGSFHGVCEYRGLIENAG
jgi:hypothetical protein